MFLFTQKPLKNVPETSPKPPGSLPEGPGGGSRGTETGQEEGQGETAQEAGGLAAGWAYLARSLTAASTAFFPSGLEFETRDGSRCGAVAASRHGLDGAGTGRLCGFTKESCALLLPLILP